ncbi:AAA family ATPase [bacterium]|nr:AAA family ATPase [bacterium]
MIKCYGRKREIQVLEFKKEGPPLLVYGLPGIGKTTLLRRFYEGLLKREKVVPGYVNLYSGIEPFSRLFANQLINLFNRLNLKGKKNDLRDMAASIKSYLEKETQSRVLKNLLLHIREHIITNGLYEVVRLTDLLYNEEDIFELGIDLSLSLKTDQIIKIVKAFEMVLEDFQLVLILDDFDLIRKEREDLFKELLSFKPERTHLYFSVSKDNFDSLDSEIRKSVTSLGLTPLDKNDLGEWIIKESPGLLIDHPLEDIHQRTKGTPLFLCQWIKGGLKEETDPMGLVDRLLSRYDQRKKRYLAKIALIRSPLSTPECARLLKIDESMTKHYLLEFEEDSLLKSAYLEREGVFCFDHPLKQERVVSILKKEFDFNQLYQELAAYFEGEISYPAEENMTCFFRNMDETIYYYGLIKDRKREVEEAYHFYQGLNALLKKEEFCPALTELTESSYFISLKTRLAIILYQLLAKCRLNDQALFKETLNELSKSRNEFLVEYSKALFYLANQTGKQQKIRETDMVIWSFSSLLGKHPENEEIKIVFAYLLYNLIYDYSSVSEFGGAKNTLNSLKSLMSKNPKLKEIKLIYAEALTTISSKLAQEGKFDDSFIYLEDLKSLSLSKEAEFLVEYTRALANLSFYLGKKKKYEALNRTIKDLDGLTKAFPDIIEIKIEYAKALVNTSATLSEKGSFKESDNFIKALGILTVGGETTQEAKNVYLSSLFNLSSDLSSAKRFTDSIDILGKIKELVLKEPGNEEILFSYARTRYNLLYDLGKNGKFAKLISNLSILKELFCRHPHREIELIYIKSLFNAAADLACAKRYDRIKELLSTLEEMNTKGFGNPGSIEIYSRALFNFSSYLGESGQYEQMRKALGLLEKLWKKGEGTAEKIYLDALLNATVHLGRGKNFEELARVTKEIKGLFALDPKLKPIYAKALVNTSAHLGKAGHFDELKKIMEEARKMTEENFDDHQIKLAYLDILINSVASLRNKDDLSSLLEIIRILKKMSQDFPEDGPAAIAYTKSLLVLADELERRGEMIELNKLMATLENLSKENHRVLAFLKAIDFPLFMI